MDEIIEKALKWAKDTAKDNTHGYSQANRWGPDYDCSSFIISAYEQAGLKLKEMPITFTERRAGYSKISGSIATETLKMVFKLRFSR